MDLTVRKLQRLEYTLHLAHIYLLRDHGFGVGRSGYMHLCLEYVGPESLRMYFSKRGGEAAQNDITFQGA